VWLCLPGTHTHTHTPTLGDESDEGPLRDILGVLIQSNFNNAMVILLIWKEKIINLKKNPFQRKDELHYIWADINIFITLKFNVMFIPSLLLNNKYWKYIHCVIIILLLPLEMPLIKLISFINQWPKYLINNKHLYRCEEHPEE
jgi:hypothetical protein